MALLMFAAPPKVTAVSITDSVTGDTSTTMTITTAPSPASESARIVIVDDNEYIIENGHAYLIDDLMEDLRDEVFSNAAMHHEDRLSVPIVAICFIFPCLTIVVALIVLLIFLLKKNSTRAKIITAAIENDYQLPDSFYVGSSASPTQTPYSATDNATSCGNGGFSEGERGQTVLGAPTVPANNRDPRSFTSGVTLLGVGLAILLAFCAHDNYGLGWICGGVPMFLGAGRLLGYFYIPGFSARKNRYQPQNNYSQPWYPGAPNQPQAPMQGNGGGNSGAWQHPQPQPQPQAQQPTGAPAQRPPIPPVPGSEGTNIPVD